MNVRVGNIAEDMVLSPDTIQHVDDFFYTKIVDDESVYFHCHTLLDDYLETLKSI